MKVITSIEEFLSYRNSLKQIIALVPTMGNLHAGHLSLVEKASELAEVVIATIFVNPMQFGANEDLDNYPRTLDEDLEALEKLGVAAVLTPLMSDIYPQGVEHHTQVMVPDVSELHCGEHRPGHFTGVATIVTKLLNICRPDIAIFGQKDYQQLAIIRKMVADLAIQTEIIGGPTVRNADGLALSSRNNYLSDSDKKTATGLFQTLTEVSDKITAGNHDYLTLASEAMAKLNNIGFEMEYINIVDQMNLLPATEDNNNLVILAAGRMAGTRLIDNLEVRLV